MKRQSPWLLLLLTSLLTNACKDPCDELPNIGTAIPLKVLSSNTTTEGQMECTVKEVEWGPEYADVRSLDPQGDVIFPGAVLNYNSFQDGAYIQIVGDRKPIKISMSLSHIGGDIGSQDVEEPALSTVREAIRKILKEQTSGATAANFAWEKTEVYSEEHLKLAVGGGLELDFLEISGSYDYSSTEIIGRFLLEFNQEYFSIDLDGIKPGLENFFEEHIECELTDGVSPVYVSSVKYGRRVFFLVESKEFDYSEIGEIAAAFEDVVGGGANSTLTKLVTEKSVKAIVMGGPAYEGVKVVSDINALQDYLEAGANFDEDSPGVPLSYQLRFVKDGSVAKLVLYDQFTIRDCKLIPPTTEKFTPNSIEDIGLNHIIGDKDFDGNGPIVIDTCILDIRGNDSEVWAKIKVDMLELGGDGTRGSRVYEVKLWSCTSDRKIVDISPEQKVFTHVYIDNDWDKDEFDFSASKSVKRLAFYGDGQGDDIDTGSPFEAKLVRLDFNEISVFTVPR